MSRLGYRSTITNPLDLVGSFSDRVFAGLERVFAGRRTWAGAILLLLVLQMTLIFGHRPWLDEWQALQIALQSPTLRDLFDNLRYEGHPPLWYLILRGIGALVGAMPTLPIAAAILATIAQAIILFRSPFSRAERLMLASGCIMMFEFLTLSRSLTLGVTIFLVALSLWRSRWIWLAIALLPLCDFLFGALSCILLVLRWREHKLWWPGVVLWLAGAGLAAWSVRPAPDVVPAMAHEGVFQDVNGFLDRMGLLLVPLQWGRTAPEWNGLLPFHMGKVAGILFFLFCARQLPPDRLKRICFWSFVALTLLFSVAVYPLATRHLMLTAWLLIGLVWLDRRQPHGCRGATGLRWWLLVGSACGLFVAAYNLAVPFDTVDAAAAAIESRHLQDRLWMAFPNSRAQGVSALTGIRFEETELRCMQTFIRWNHRSEIQEPAQLAQNLRRAAATNGRFYLASDLPLGRFLSTDILQPIVHIPAGYDGIGYYFFVVGANLPERQVRLPLCAPSQRPLPASGYLFGRR